MKRKIDRTSCHVHRRSVSVPKVLKCALDNEVSEMAGRPRAAVPAQTISFRTRSDLKLRLEAAAAKNGRSLAQETERRLEASFNVGEVSDIETPTGVLFQAIRSSIDLIHSQLGHDWWKTGNSATMLEGVLTGVSERLVKPFPDQKLWSNKLLQKAEADNPDAQEALRAQYLDDGAAIARLATQRAFDRRGDEYPIPEIDTPERKTRRRLSSGQAGEAK